MNLTLNFAPPKDEQKVLQISYNPFEIDNNPNARPKPNKPVRQKALLHEVIQIPPHNERPGVSVVNGIAYYVGRQRKSCPSPSCSLGSKKGRGKCNINYVSKEYEKEIRQAERGKLEVDEQKLDIVLALRKLESIYCFDEASYEEQIFQREEEEEFEQRLRHENVQRILRSNSRSFEQSFCRETCNDSEVILADQLVSDQENQPEIEFLTVDEFTRERPRSSLASYGNSRKCDQAPTTAEQSLGLEMPSAEQAKLRRPQTATTTVRDGANNEKSCSTRRSFRASGGASSETSRRERRLQHETRDVQSRSTSRSHSESPSRSPSPPLIERNPGAEFAVRPKDEFSARQETVISADQSLINQAFLGTTGEERAVDGTMAIPRRRNTVCECFSFYQ